MASLFHCLLLLALAGLAEGGEYHRRVAGVLLRSHSEKLQRGDAALHKSGIAADPTMESAALKRGIEEIAIANNAFKQASQSAKDAKAAQQNLVAVQAIGSAEAAYTKVKPLLPEARAQFITVRKFAAEAAMHAQHAQEVLFGSRHIAEDAAQKAYEATKGWIMRRL